MTKRRETGNGREARPEDKALMIRRRVLERDSRRLKVALTPEELRAASRRIGSVMRQRLQEEAAFEAQRGAHKAKMSDYDNEIADLGVILDTETKEADVECVTETNWEDDTADTRRTDTDEVIARRPLTAAEKQHDLFVDAPQRKRGRRKPEVQRPEVQSQG